MRVGIDCSLNIAFEKAIAMVEEGETLVSHSVVDRGVNGSGEMFFVTVVTVSERSHKFMDELPEFDMMSPGHD